MYDLSEEISLEKNKKHNIEVVVDRLILRPDVVHRLTDSCETAAALSGGLILANILPDDRDILFSQNYACEDCGISIEELTPRMFSFNNPFGACPTCTGLGTQLKVDPELVIPNKSVSLLDGAICASGWNNVRGDGISRMYFEALSKKYHFLAPRPCGKALQRGHGRHSLRHKGRKAWSSSTTSRAAREFVSGVRGYHPQLRAPLQGDAEQTACARS